MDLQDDSNGAESTMVMIVNVESRIFERKGVHNDLFEKKTVF